ncbi:hypothetical protein W5A_09725 [Imtechella halotolerans K1]|uniref:Uncharacterized protein n=2 Tax=Imtechella TaxID=1165076 RepID=I0WBR8_9FLAO|nr:hypothetical protein W5A_09725 [Imtechella halotolerans K1]
MLFFALLSCKEKSKLPSTNPPKQEKITIIEWSNYGGDLGFAQTLTITKDSITHSEFLAADNNNITVNKYKNTNENWEYLINSFKWSDFKKIKSGESVQEVDGTDQKIHIKTNTTSDSIINGHEDKLNYSKISTFIKLLDKIIDENKKSTANKDFG